MVTIDYLLIAVFVLSAILGIYRGFVKEALSLVGWVAAVWVAWRYGARVAEWGPDFSDDLMVRIWVARVVILVAVLFASGVVSVLVSFLMGKTGLDGTDRAVGMLFGLGRGLVLAAIVINVLQFAGFEANPWWDKSQLITYIMPVADSLSDIADDGMEMLREGAGRLETPLFSLKE
jgi:membrane protein required for colicin V production